MLTTSVFNRKGKSDDASEIDEELFTPIRTMLEILESFKNDEGNNRRISK